MLCLKRFYFALFRLGRVAKYCDAYVCLSVCLSTRIIWKPHDQTLPLPISFWLSPSLAALRYVMYFRFCRWRHVFIHGGQCRQNDEGRYYFASERVQSIAFSPVCLSVCLSVRSNVSKTTRPNFARFVSKVARFYRSFDMVANWHYHCQLPPSNSNLTFFKGGRQWKLLVGRLAFLRSNWHWNLEVAVDRWNWH